MKPKKPRKPKPAKSDKDKIEYLKDRCMRTYDLYQSLKNDLYELDELEGDRLNEWSESHEG